MSTVLGHLIGASVLLALGLATASASAANRFRMCNGLLLPQAFAKSHLAFDPEEHQRDRPTVEFGRPYRNAQGDAFHRLRRRPEETSWSSGYAPLKYAPQGDPRLPLMAFGPDLARVLGFSFTAKGALLVPTPDTINRRLEIFNAFLVTQGLEPIPVRFYPQIRAELLSFIKEWAVAPRVPVHEGRSLHTVHDISFHYSTVLLPPQILRLLQTEAQILSALMRFSFDTVAMDPEKTAAMRRFFRGPLRHSAQVIDSVSTSANIGNFEGDPDYEVERFISLFFFATYEEAVAHWTEYARMTTSLSAFTNSFLNLNDELPEEQEAVFDRFRYLIAPSYPEWSLTFDELGLGTRKAVQDLYVNRATELRRAARLFIEGT